jgi:hypothetical protein
MRKISAIKKSIDTLSRNTKTLRDKYHVALCEVAGHAFEHGDPRLFDNILNAASGMARKEMAKWINANGFARVTKDGCVVNKSARKEADFVDGDAVITYLMDQPKWYETEQSIAQIVNELDAVQRIKSLTSQVSKDGAVLKTIDLAAYRQAMQDLDDAIKAVA